MMHHPDLFDVAQSAPSLDGLDPELLAIVRVLETRTGARNAISAWDIAQRANILPDASREVRRTRARTILAQHYDDLPFIVVSNSDGYYRPETLDEVQHYLANLISRMQGIAVRAESYLKQVGRSSHRPYMPPAATITKLLNHLSSLK